MATRALAVFYAALSAGALAASGVGLAEPGLVGVWGVNTGWTLAGLAAFISMAAAARRVGRNRVGWAWRLWASGAGLWLLGALAGDALTLAGVRGGLTVTVLWSLFAVFSIAGLAYRSVPGFFSFQLSLLDALPIVLAVTAVSVASGTLPGGDSLFVPAILAAALYAYVSSSSVAARVASG